MLIRPNKARNIIRGIDMNEQNFVAVDEDIATDRVLLDQMLQEVLTEEEREVVMDFYFGKMNETEISTHRCVSTKCVEKTFKLAMWKLGKAAKKQRYKR